MSSLYTHQDENIRQTYLLFGAFMVLVTAIGWFFSYLYGNSTFLYLAVGLSLGLNFFSYWYSDKVVLSLTRAHLADPVIDQGLIRVVENLAITAGLPTPKVYVVDDPAPNAFATGRDKEHAVVAATTGLLAMLDHTELEGVIAHELSHVGNRDILISTVAVVLAGCISILADIFLRSARFGGRSRDNEKGNGPLFLVGIVIALFAPLFATLMRLAISRKREFLADASGALLTRYPEGLARALEKIGAYARPMIAPSSATAHLFFSNPFGAGKRSFTTLFMTHPPIEERIKALRGE